MKLAVISDIHDHVWNLEAALGAIRDQAPSAVICCGDLCSPFVVGLIKQAMHLRDADPIPVHIVFGNNDADQYRMVGQAVPDRLTFHGELAEFLVQADMLVPRASLVDATTRVDRFFDPAREGLRIAVNHFNYIAEPIALSTRYDLVLYGHNHAYRHARNARTTLLNPGTLMGYNPTKAGNRAVEATYAIYDTEFGTVDWFEVVPTASAGGQRLTVRSFAVNVEPLLDEAA